MQEGRNTATKSTGSTSSKAQTIAGAGMYGGRCVSNKWHNRSSASGPQRALKTHTQHGSSLTTSPGSTTRGSEELIGNKRCVSVVCINEAPTTREGIVCQEYYQGTLNTKSNSLPQSLPHLFCSVFLLSSHTVMKNRDRIAATGSSSITTMPPPALSW